MNAMKPCDVDLGHGSGSGLGYGFGEGEGSGYGDSDGSGEGNGWGEERRTAMNKPYHYEIPASQYDGVVSRKFDTIEECVEDCRRACAALNVDYDRRDVMLFMTDADGVWEVTEDGELAG